MQASWPGSSWPGSTWLRAALLVAVLAAGLVVALTVRLPGRAELRGDLAAAGAAGPLVFVALYAVATLSPLPKTVLTALAGLLFGVVEGVALVGVAALLGATAGFFLGRLLGRDAAQRLVRGRLDSLDAQLRRRGLLAVIVARLVPVVPFTTINYLSGLTAVALRDFLLGTAIGILPTTTAYVALGAYGSEPGSWPFVSAVAALVLLSVGGLVAGRRRRRRGRATTGRSTRAGRAGLGWFHPGTNLEGETMSVDSANGVTEISDFGKQLWSYLTGSEAVIDYSFVDLKVGVPKTTGTASEVAYWSLNGTLRITTTDKHNSGASSANGS